MGRTVGSGGLTSRDLAPYRSGAISLALVQLVAAGMATLILAGLLGSVLVRRSAYREAHQTAANLTDAIAQNFLEPRLTPQLLAGHPGELLEFDRLVREKVLQGPVTWLMLRTADGRVVYSNERQLTGATLPLRDQEAQVLNSGAPTSRLVTSTELQKDSRRHNDRLLRVEERVTTLDGQPLLFESYLALRPPRSRAAHYWRSYAPHVLGVLALLELLQVPLAWWLSRNVREGERQRTLLVERAIEASKRERDRIVADLHDGAVQDLVAASFKLSTLSEALDRAGCPGHPELRALVQKAAHQTRRSLRQLRTLLVQIQPPDLEQLGLAPALSQLVAPLTARGVITSVEVPAGLQLPDEVEAELFRMAQEALRNVEAHAQARHVRLAVSRRGQTARLEVKDDGRGFSLQDVERRRAEGHLGLRLLQERATAAGGVLTVDSRPGKGTHLTVEVSLS